MVTGIVSVMQSPEVTQAQSGGNIVITSTPSTPPHTTPSTHDHAAAGHSPGRISDLRMRNIKELWELQQLLELNILTQEEFEEQKAVVLGAMRKLVQ